MHRSGTSLAASVVCSTGLTLPPGQHLPALPENPEGFWETMPIVRLHDWLLEQINGDWDAPPDLDPFALHGALLELPPNAIGRVRDSMPPSGTDPWFVKDPRLSLLLPAWDRACGVTIPAVVCVRDPGEVANSLLKRNGIPPRLGLALWFVYTRTALCWARSRPYYLISYEHHVQEPDAVAEELAAWLGEGGSPVTALPQVRADLRRADARIVARDEPEALTDCRDRYALLSEQSELSADDAWAPPPWVHWELHSAARVRDARQSSSIRVGRLG